MHEYMKKLEFLELIHTARSELVSVLSEIPRDKMELKDDGMEWTVKDVIAHIGWYENEMVNLLRQKSLEGSEWWNLSLQERNDAIQAMNRGRDLQSVMDSEADAYQNLLNFLEDLNEADLNDPAAFASMPVEWQPWSVIASNTHEHYQDHVEQLKKHLK